MAENNQKKAGIAALISALFAKHKKGALAALLVLLAGAVGGVALLSGGSGSGGESGTEIIEKFWPDAFIAKADDEPPFEDDPNRTNDAFNVIDFGAQGSNGWFYRYGDYRKPERSHRLERFNGEAYTQTGANGLEIKNNFVHTAQGVSPILEWRAAQNGKVNVTVAYVKNVNGDANPSYPDGVQLLVYKGKELLKLENVPISTTEENFALIEINDLEVKKLDSLYFVVNPNTNNAYDGGSLYAAVSDVNKKQTIPSMSGRTDNNANSTNDFGEQGSNGWMYMYGNEPSDCHPVSHEKDGEYIDRISPSLTIKKDFIHPSLNHNAVLAWNPAVSGNVDVRLRYTKFEQNDGMPDFPDGVRVKIFKNDTELYNEHVDVPDSGEILIKKRIPSMAVTPLDMLYFMVDAEGNSSYDGGALDVTIIDINGTTDESSVATETGDIRQNIADVKNDFGPQGSNGWIFQSGYGDDPFNARNMAPFDPVQDRYFSDNWLEIKRDYVNTGEHDSSAIIKWKVAQNGTISIRASYTKMKNEDKNPAWPDGTRVSLYANNTLLARQTFEPLTNQEVTKRLDIASLNVRQGDYITMVVNGIDNNAYDGGKYEFAINSLSGLVGNTEKNVPATYNGTRTNFASTLDDFSGTQGYNGWYYQYGFNRDPFCAVNIENCENNEKYYTTDGVEIKKDYIVPARNGKSANVKWVAAETGVINIDLLYKKLLNEDANPSWPDGVTVLLMKNGTVLKEQYFAPRTDVVVTGDLSVYGVPVNKGDCITMIVDPGENAAYDGGNYLFVIEDAGKTPTVAVGNNDNSTILNDLSSMTQGTDGWWFLEGTEPSNAKVLTKKSDDGLGYESRRSEGLVMKKDMVHTGSYLDPIYQWLPGEDGQIDISGTYVKWGQEDANPSWPDGVTVKIWRNNQMIYRQKVAVRRGDGNDNVIDFNFEKMNVKRGDKLSFQICQDNNWAWDGGRLSVVIEPTATIDLKPGDDNRTVLAGLESIDQGTDGWYFMEGTEVAKAKPLTKKSDDGSAYLSVRDAGLEMKKDYVHTGGKLSAIYKWVVKEAGKIDLSGSYVKFPHNDANPSWPDGITLTIYQNDKEILKQKVEAKQGDGNDNIFDFNFEGMEVKANDVISFMISPDNNNAWDAGKLSVAIEPTVTIDLKPGDDNKTVLADLESIDQGTDGWYFMEGTEVAKAKPLTNKSEDGSAYKSVKDEGLEMKKDYVHTGAKLSAIYKWVVKEDGKIDLSGSYVKFAHNDTNPSWPDGITLTIYQNDKEILKQKVEAKQGDGNDNIFDFNFEEMEVEANDVISFMISPDNNNAWDAGRLNVRIGDGTEETEPAPYPEDRTNNTVLADHFGEPGSQGWYYGYSNWNGTVFTSILTKDGEAYKGDNGLELKADFVHPGPDGDHSAAYKWVVAKDGKIKVEGEYTKEPNSADASADGVTFRIALNGDVKVWRGDGIKAKGITEAQTVTFDETYDVKAGDTLVFAINPEDNNSYDGGKLSVRISDAEEGETEPAPYPEDRTNNTVLADHFGEPGSQGWYYGYSNWNGTVFTSILNKDGEVYKGDNGLELKADFAHPGPDSDHSAAYKWVVAKDGKIKVEGEYTKEPNSADANADGITFRIALNGKEDFYGGDATKGSGITEPVTVTFDKTYDVKAGDTLVFAINPQDNNSYDGGKLSVRISDAEGGEPETEPAPYPEDRTNNTVLADHFGEPGSQGWYYGYSNWNGSVFTSILTKDGEAYKGDNGLELKADFVHPGPDSDHSAAYKWVVAKDGKIKVEGEYTKEPNSADANADGITFRIALNGKEDFYGGDATKGSGITEPVTVTFDKTYDVKAGDTLVFAINPQDNNSYDGGKLSVRISEVKDEEPAAEYKVSYEYDQEYPQEVMDTLPSDDQTYADGLEVTAKAPSAVSVAGKVNDENGTWDFQGWDAETKTVQAADVKFTGSWKFTRTNNAVLKDDFSGTQGKNGWYYGMCDWDGKNFEELPYDAANNRYMNNGAKPELKADFVEPSNDKNAAYKWVAARDGKIKLDGEYVKFANNEDPNANGTCFRIFINAAEVENGFYGDTMGNFAEERKVVISREFEVKKGDEIMIGINSEGNDSYDGGRLSLTISAID